MAKRLVIVQGRRITLQKRSATGGSRRPINLFSQNLCDPIFFVTEAMLEKGNYIRSKPGKAFRAHTVQILMGPPPAQQYRPVQSDCFRCKYYFHPSRKMRQFPWFVQYCSPSGFLHFPGKDYHQGPLGVNQDSIEGEGIWWTPLLLWEYHLAKANPALTTSCDEPTPDLELQNHPVILQSLTHHSSHPVMSLSDLRVTR